MGKPSAITVQKPQKPVQPQISPSWLDAIIPPDWMAVAGKLCEIATTYRASDEQMREWISVSIHAPIPLVAAVESLASGEWVIEKDAGGNIHVRDKNPVIVPNPAQIQRFKN